MSSHVVIVAEAGVNHNGSLTVAKQLVDAAVAAGADIVKFQTFKADKLVTSNAKTAEYQQRNAGESSQLEMLRKLELTPDDHYSLVRYCGQKGIRFWSTAFDLDSVEYLHSLNLGLWKIPSGEITNYPYLKKIAQYREPVIMSTGMCEMSDIDAAVNVFLKYGLAKEQIIIMHCNTEYPTPMADVNLRAMLQIGKALGVKVGYSDHTQGIEIPIAAVAMGAEVIEKHLTLDKSLPGPDQLASLNPDEFKMMVTSIRNIEQALGDGQKKISPSESKNVSVARKSIVAASPIEKGDAFTENNLTVKRPGTGLSPMLWEQVIGQRAKRRFETDELIEL